MGKYALIIVSALVFSIITYSMGLRSAMFTSTLRIVDTFSSNQAHNIAQSTMMVVMNDIREHGSDSQFLPAPGGSYQFPNSGLEPWNDINGSYRIETSSSGDTLLVSIAGSFEGRTSMAQAGLLEEIAVWNPQFNHAVHTEGEITLNGGALIKGHVSTNSTAQNAVYLSRHAYIDSSLYVGPGGDPNYVVNKQDIFANNVGLETLALTERLDYPMPVFPDYPSADMVGAYVELEGGDSSRTLLFSEYDGYYLPKITVEGGNHLTIEVIGESVLYTSRFELNTGHIHLTGTGSLRIFVEETFAIEGNSTINEGGDTNRFFMLYGGTTDLEFRGTTVYNAGVFSKTANVTIEGTNTFQGSIISGGNEIELTGNATVNSRVIYAPNTDVSMSGNSIINGAVVSNTFTASNNSIVDFTETPDDELPDLTSADNVYTLLYWN